jgi:hypothetical protein
VVHRRHRSRGCDCLREHLEAFEAGRPIRDH